MANYDVDAVVSLNKLWGKIFFFLSRHVERLYGKTKGTVLEFGVFSGGISIELAKLSDQYEMYIAGLESEALVASIKEWARKEVPFHEITIVPSLKDFENDTFDLLICRGFFFYLKDQSIFRDIIRVLKPQGIAIVGGGFGADTPQELIDEISHESKILNERLGRKWFEKSELRHILEENHLIEQSQIIMDGGVWIKILKS